MRTVVESIIVLKGMVTGASPPLGGVLTPILSSLLDFTARYAADPTKRGEACGKMGVHRPDRDRDGQAEARDDCRAGGLTDGLRQQDQAQSRLLS